MRHKMKATQRNSGKAMGLSAEGSSIALPRRPSAMVSNTERTIKTNIISLDCRFIISCILNAILTGIRFTSITPCIEGYLHQLYVRGIFLSKWTGIETWKSNSLKLLSKKAVHLIHCLLLHGRKHMRISIHRCAKCAMSKNFLNNLSRNPHTEQKCCSTMPQIMKTDVDAKSNVVEWCIVEKHRN